MEENKYKKEVRDLMGGAKGEAGRQQQEFNWKGNADQRAEAQLGLSREQIKHEARRLGLTEAEFMQNMKLAKQNFNFNAQLEPYKLAQAKIAADPRQRYSADISALASLARTNGLTTEEASRVAQQALRLSQQSEAENADWMARNRPPGAPTPNQDRFRSEISAAPPEKKPWWNIFGGSSVND